MAKGSGKETGQLLPYPCTYKECTQRFESEKEMKRHKLADPEHNYCKKCDVDCADWEGLTQHKVDAMAPWLEGKMRENKDESPKHIVCEFCGEDFKSFGGRKLHRTQMHPADQRVECPGCKMIFIRASNLMQHLEQGRCEFISKRQFTGYAQQKQVTGEIMKNPDQFQASFAANRQSEPYNGQPGLITDGSEELDTEAGSVGLIDQDDEQQGDGYQPLEARSRLIETEAPVRSTGDNKWPHLPNSPASGVTESMRNMALNSRTTSVSGSEVSTNGGSSALGHRGGRHSHTESYPSLNSPDIYASGRYDDGQASVTSTTINGSSAGPERGAWTTGNTSKTLFKDALPQPLPGDWSAIYEQREEEALANDKTNLLYVRWWDPTSPDYNPNLFFHNVLQKYMCPFTDCDGNYDIAADIQEHLQSAHLKRTYRCPSCLKILKTATGLLAHAESNGRCSVKDSNEFKKLIDEISGGILKAKRVEEPRIYRPEKALVKAGQPVNGVMSVEFSTQMPRQR